MILQKNLLYDNSSQANFQNWAQGISTAMASCGLTQSADTGQVVWSTNPAVPAATGLTPFYEIWEFADSFASTSPVFIKLQYGTAVSAGLPGFTISVGTSTNGAGLLGGNLFGPYSVFPSGSPTGASIWECDFSGAPGRFGMMLWRNCSTAVAPIFFAVERSVNSTGSYTGAYTTILFANGSNQGNGGAYQASLLAPGTGSIFLQSQTSWVTPAVSSSTTGFGSSSAFLPVFPLVGKLDNPVTVAGVVKSGDQGEAGAFTVSLYGNSRTYLYSKATAFDSVGLGTNNGIAMRWD